MYQVVFIYNLIISVMSNLYSLSIFSRLGMICTILPLAYIYNRSSQMNGMCMRIQINPTINSIRLVLNKVTHLRTPFSCICNKYTPSNKNKSIPNPNSAPLNTKCHISHIAIAKTRHWTQNTNWHNACCAENWVSVRVSCARRCEISRDKPIVADWSCEISREVPAPDDRSRRGHCWNSWYEQPYG